MKKIAANLSWLFSAGALGGLANAVMVGVYKYVSTRPELGAHFSNSLNPPMIYQRVVWGGLWAILFLLPLKIKNIYLRGLLLSLAPTLTQLLIVFPAKGQGYFGQQLGMFTFLQVLAFNAVWGLMAAWWLDITHLYSTDK